MSTPINQILDWFRTGKKPTQDQFWQSWTSFWHKNEQIPQSNINGLTSVLSSKAERTQLQGHINDSNGHNLNERLAQKSNLGHTHLMSEITGLTQVVDRLQIIEGITLEANQATSEVYLKDGTGTTLATLNVAFLNNEGTTFFYNEVTGNLELKNDAGEVLSTVPVSAFVANLPKTISFNGTTPSTLQLKDTEGNVLSVVTITINNVEGLQNALNNKANLSGGNTYNGSQIVDSGAITVKDAPDGTALKFIRGTGGVQFAMPLNSDSIGLYNKAGTVLYQNWKPDGSVDFFGNVKTHGLSSNNGISSLGNAPFYSFQTLDGVQIGYLEHDGTYLNIRNSIDGGQIRALDPLLVQNATTDDHAVNFGQVQGDNTYSTAAVDVATDSLHSHIILTNSGHVTCTLRNPINNKHKTAYILCDGVAGVTVTTFNGSAHIVEEGELFSSVTGTTAPWQFYCNGTRWFLIQRG
ncbi:hypothetical protein [Flavobacterium sp. '19STA2R22 D10 B1']|uniref:hypothetical protein n=1 Tax=Flavobacterium aerium TaxID=3037261 RepID=UPI00278C1C1B|nr:hypothetical protein [Flavobacterium sp. '19STA2R22 D10 B1']